MGFQVWDLGHGYGDCVPLKQNMYSLQTTPPTTEHDTLVFLTWCYMYYHVSDVYCTCFPVALCAGEHCGHTGA